MKPLHEHKLSVKTDVNLTDIYLYLHDNNSDFTSTPALHFDVHYVHKLLMS